MHNLLLVLMIQWSVEFAISLSILVDFFPLRETTVYKGALVVLLLLNRNNSVARKRNRLLLQVEC